MSNENESKTIDFSGRLFWLVLVLVAAMALSNLATFLMNWQSYNGGYPRSISVEGIGKAYVKPDVAAIMVGVNSDGATATKVVEDNNVKINAIIDAVKGAGVPAEDIQTISYDLYPKYDYTDVKGSFVNGYTLNQQLKIKIRDFDKISSVIKVSTEKGSNLIGSLSFEVDDPDTALAAARTDAIKKAKEKAKLMQEQTGLRFSKVLGYYEYSDNPYPQPYYADGKGGGGMATAEVTAPSIQPGQQEITLRVNLEYQVR